jgi:CubicO group peptidase (beta-lactamase class C family)
MNASRWLLRAGSVGLGLVMGLSTAAVRAQMEFFSLPRGGAAFDETGDVEARASSWCSWGFSPAELEACVDYLAKHDERALFYPRQADHVAGAAVAIVYRDENGEFQSFTKGYGCADIGDASGNGHEPVHAKKGEPQTRFRIGSVSKLVAATALLHLIEEKKLDVDKTLERDVNDFLPDDFPRVPPTTLKNILTHTGGFENNQIGFLAHEALSEADAKGPNRYLALHMPARVHAPTTNYDITQGSTAGIDSIYSSWAMSLIGEVVRKLSEKPFDLYVRKHVLSELEMDDSDFREPANVEKEWPTMAKGHGYVGPVFKRPAPDPSYETKAGCPPDLADGARFERRGFEYLHPVGPAAGFTTTAADMAQFMIMHLREGEYGNLGKRMLDKHTADLMHGRILIPHADPGFNAGGLAFHEMQFNGRRIISHGGTTLRFSSKLALLPDEKLGIFIATNSPVSDMLLRNFIVRFLNAHPHAPGTPPQIPGDPSAAPLDVEGVYLTSAFSVTRNEKFLQLTIPTAETKVETLKSGNLKITNHFGNAEWTPVANAPNVFRLSHETIAFVRAGEGGIALLGPMPFAPAHKVLSRYDLPGFHARLLKLAMAVFVVVLGWGLLRLIGTAPAGSGARWALIAAAATAALNLAAYRIIWNFFTTPDVLLYGYTLPFKAALVMLLASVATTLVVVAFVVLAWLRKFWTLPERLAYALFGMVALAFLWSMNHWNLIGCHMT